MMIYFSLKNRHHPCVRMSSCPHFPTASHGHVGPFWWRSNLTSVCGFGLVREKESRGNLKLQTHPVFYTLINPSWWKTTASEKKVMSLTLGILPSSLSLPTFCQTLHRLFFLYSDLMWFICWICNINKGLKCIPQDIPKCVKDET